MIDILKFVKDSELSEPIEYSNTHESTYESVTDELTEIAEINAGSLIVFDAKLSKQNISDVSDSILFAQLASNKAFDRFSQPVEWYKNYSSVLGQIGWSQTGFEYSSTTEDPPVGWDKFVISKFTQEKSKELVQAGILSADSLKKDSKALNIWNSFSSDNNVANYQIIPTVLVNEHVIASILSILSKLASSPDKFLSWKLFYDIGTYYTKAVLNEEVYSQVRQAIIDKLGDRRKTDVATLPRSMALHRHDALSPLTLR